MKRVLLLIVLLTILLGCATKHQTVPLCEETYVILPGNYIVDLAAGSQIFLDPAVQPFHLFCTQRQAREALSEIQPKGDWRIFKLAGAFPELATPYEDGRYILATPAEVTEWVETD